MWNILLNSYIERRYLKSKLRTIKVILLVESLVSWLFI